MSNPYGPPGQPPGYGPPGGQGGAPDGQGGAPGVARLRAEVGETLRQAILRSGSPDLMSTWTRSAWGSDDYDMWLAQRGVIGPASPLRPLVDGQLARLDRELGI